MAPDRRPWRDGRRLAVGLAVVALAVLTPAVVLVRVASYVGSDRPTISTGPARQYFAPPPTALEVTVAGPDGSRSVTVATPRFPPFRGADLVVRLRSVPAGTTVTATVVDAAGTPLTTCARRAGEAAATVALTCRAGRPEAVRTLTVAAGGAPGTVLLEARRDRYGETASELVGAAPPGDLTGRLGRALASVGVLRPAAASPPVLLVAWAASLALSGFAVLALLDLRRGPMRGGGGGRRAGEEQDRTG